MGRNKTLLGLIFLYLLFTLGIIEIHIIYRHNEYNFQLNFTNKSIDT